ncbi:MAG TPA: cytochrome c3 family protein [Nitrospirota bacterium]
MLRKLALSLSFVLLGAGAAFAAGGHEGMQCTGCHNIHDAKGQLIFEVAPNTKAMPQGSVMPSKSISALCLGCHADADKGGMGIAPVSQHTSHPWGSVPNKKRANVPDILLRNGALDCVSCHDPHPSNTNYRYLRVDTAGGKKMANFCAACHASKADKSASGGIKFFSSMDEEAYYRPEAQKK